MCISCTIAELNDSKESKQFDAWLHIASVGNKITMDIPIKFLGTGEAAGDFSAFEPEKYLDGLLA